MNRKGISTSFTMIRKLGMDMSGGKSELSATLEFYMRKFLEVNNVEERELCLMNLKRYMKVLLTKNQK